VLGGVGMSVHHKLCHTLGGSLDLPHAETHAIMLPHTIAFVADATRAQLAPATDIFGGSLGGALYDFAASVEAPLRLVDLGVAESDLDRICEMAITAPYWSPRPLDRDAIRDLLQNAWAGHRPVDQGGP
jgi:maleylacetate reductase